MLRQKKRVNSKLVGLTLLQGKKESSIKVILTKFSDLFLVEHGFREAARGLCFGYQINFLLKQILSGSRALAPAQHVNLLPYLYPKLGSPFYASIRPFLTKLLTREEPVFSFKVEKVDKRLQKYSRGKSGKFFLA